MALDGNRFKISHSRHFNNDIGLVQMIKHGIIHLVAGAHRDTGHTDRRVKTDRTGHQDDIGSPFSAAPAMAYPILPEEWLLINRTGSMGSTVGPAETRTVFPLRSFL